MAYEIAYRPSARRQFAALPRDIQARIARRFDGLAEEPRPHGVVAVRGIPGRLRLRVGDYRVLYRVDDAERPVIVERIGHRNDVYG